MRDRSSPGRQNIGADPRYDIIQLGLADPERILHIVGIYGDIVVERLALAAQNKRISEGPRLVCQIV